MTKLISSEESLICVKCKQTKLAVDFPHKYRLAGVKSRFCLKCITSYQKHRQETFIAEYEANQDQLIKEYQDRVNQTTVSDVEDTVD